MIVILDNGHGEDTAGKRSPVFDGEQLFEYEFNRDIVRRITNFIDFFNMGCPSSGIDYHLLVPEIKDIYWKDRIRRANQFCRKNKDSWVLSIHANAGGGTGWEGWTSRGQTRSDKYCEIFYNNAEKSFEGWPIRKDITDGDKDKEAGFFMLKHTTCPSVLTESFFMDTKKDFDYITSEDGRDNIAQLHVEAILEIYKKYYNG